MKTSHIIIATVAVLFIIFAAAAMFVLRDNVLELVEIAERESKYRPVEVEDFERLDFSDRWTALIRHGRNYKVEVKPEEGVSSVPRVTNESGTLYFNASADTTTRMYAKITAPSLREIKAAQKSQVTLEGFKSDSMRVALGEDGAFTGKENTFTHMIIRSGKSLVELIDDPNK